MNKEIEEIKRLLNYITKNNPIKLIESFDKFYFLVTVPETNDYGFSYAILSAKEVFSPTLEEFSGYYGLSFNAKYGGDDIHEAFNNNLSYLRYVSHVFDSDIFFNNNHHKCNLENKSYQKLLVLMTTLTTDLPMIERMKYIKKMDLDYKDANFILEYFGYGILTFKNKQEALEACQIKNKQLT